MPLLASLLSAHDVARTLNVTLRTPEGLLKAGAVPARDPQPDPDCKEPDWSDARKLFHHVYLIDNMGVSRFAETDGPAMKTRAKEQKWQSWKPAVSDAWSGSS